MTTTQGVGEGSERWGMLSVVSLGIFALTLNWFDVATAFPPIGAEFKVGLGPLSFPSRSTSSLWPFAYPGGMLATSIGMKKTLYLVSSCRESQASCPGCRTATTNSPSSESSAVSAVRCSLP